MIALQFIFIKMMMVMIVMHVHEMSWWYDDMVVCVNATSIYVSYEKMFC